MKQAKPPMQAIEYRTSSDFLLDFDAESSVETALRAGSATGAGVQ
jgi:hypothetical protein